MCGHWRIYIKLVSGSLVSRLLAQAGSGGGRMHPGLQGRREGGRDASRVVVRDSTGPDRRCREEARDDGGGPPDRVNFTT